MVDGSDDFPFQMVVICRFLSPLNFQAGLLVL